jgi:hypothetical protein
MIKLAWIASLLLAFALGHVLGSPTLEPRFVLPDTGFAWSQGPVPPYGCYLVGRMTQ